MSGAEWGALATVVVGVLAGVGWLIGQINGEARARREADQIIHSRLDEVEKRHATKDDIEHVNRGIDRLHQSVENLTTLIRDSGRP